jgi:hypothetical protein
VGLVDHEDGSKDESDIIYYQDPAAGDVRDQGMQIDLWASKKTLAELEQNRTAEFYLPNESRYVCLQSISGNASSSEPSQIFLRRL